MSESELRKIVQQVLSRPLSAEEDQRLDAAWIAYKDPRRMYSQIRSVVEFCRTWRGLLIYHGLKNRPTIQNCGDYHGKPIVGIWTNGADSFLADGVSEQLLEAGILYRNPDGSLGSNEYLVDDDKVDERARVTA